MALARICDRCKGVYSKNTQSLELDSEHSGKVKGVILIFESDSINNKNLFFDLCPDCARKFIDFMKIGIEE